MTPPLTAHQVEAIATGWSGMVVTATACPQARPPFWRLTTARSGNLGVTISLMASHADLLAIAPMVAANLRLAVEDNAWRYQKRGPYNTKKRRRGC